MAAVLVTGTRAEAMRAAMEACCCGSGSGSGSGGGGDPCLNCCGYCCGPNSEISGAPGTLEVALVSSCLGSRSITLELDAECFDNEAPVDRARVLSWRYTDPDTVDGVCTSCLTGLGTSWSDAGKLSVALVCVSYLDAATGALILGSQWNMTVTWFTASGNISMNTAAIIRLDQNTSRVIGTFSYDFTCDPFYLLIEETSASCSGVGVPVTTICTSCVGSSLTVEVTL